MKSKERERTSIRAKESLYKDLLAEYSNADEKYPRRIDAVDKEMNQILHEKDNLSTEQYRTLIKLEHISDKIIQSPNNEPIVGVIDTQFNKEVYFNEWVEYRNMLSPDIPLNRALLIFSARLSCR